MPGLAGNEEGQVMASFEVVKRGGGSVYCLRDESSGASACILPSYGFNLFDLCLPVRGEPRRVIQAAEGFAESPSHPARSGVPILFPYPNRVRGARFSFGGKEYLLPQQKPPHAIHGFALDANWDVIDHGADRASAFVAGRFQISRNAPDRLGAWPADAILEARYTLSGAGITLQWTVENPSSQVLPYGFGIHPYFYLPFRRGGRLEATRITLPASTYWVLEDCLPTGEVRAVPPELDFRNGRPRLGLSLDHVFSGLDYEGGWGICRLVDLEENASLTIRFDRGFRELVVFTPAGQDDVIAIEPYTQTTDAINLATKAIDGGLRLLAPGRSETLTIVFETADACQDAKKVRAAI